MGDDDDLDDAEKELLGEIRHRRKVIVAEHRSKKTLHSGNSVMPRSKHHAASIADLQSGLESVGMDATAAVTRARSASAARVGRKRERSRAPREDSAAPARDESMAGAAKRQHSTRSRSMSRGTPCTSAPSSTNHVHHALMRAEAVT